MVSLIADLFLISGCLAETTGETDITVLSLEASDLPAGYVIDLPFSPFEDEIECDGDFCVVTGGSFSASKTAESGNISVDQEILVYSQPVTKELLVQVFNESYPELSTWNIGELVAPEIGNESVAFNYTVPEDIGPKNSPLTGFVIIFGNGDVYETFKSTGGTYDDLKEIAEVAAGKLQKIYESGVTFWKPTTSFRCNAECQMRNCDEACQMRNREDEKRRAAEYRCHGSDSCSGAY